ncbi:hypothetical protein AVEN_24786-1 [Araneus ventricosus]|uniref:Uncharacterized protein n=1 Tax=Araneus ventricosus TaxID=182803 RepID=A0A4Y2ISA9_ARAVE|nr:hypothetical protein AVEN_24786-1 [Araneus ventricosus]
MFHCLLDVTVVYTFKGHMIIAIGTLNSRKKSPGHAKPDFSHIIRRQDQNSSVCLVITTGRMHDRNNEGSWWLKCAVGDVHMISPTACGCRRQDGEYCGLPDFHCGPVTPSNVCFPKPRWTVTVRQRPCFKENIGSHCFRSAKQSSIYCSGR